MWIRNQRLVVKLVGDKAEATLSWDLGIQQEFESQVGYVQDVGLPPVAPSERSIVPTDQFVQPGPTATWKEYHQEITFEVPRPRGLWPIRLHGTISVRP